MNGIRLAQDLVLPLDAATPVTPEEELLWREKERAIRLSLRPLQQRIISARVDGRSDAEIAAELTESLGYLYTAGRVGHERRQARKRVIKQLCASGRVPSRYPGGCHSTRSGVLHWPNCEHRHVNKSVPTFRVPVNIALGAAEIAERRRASEAFERGLYGLRLLAEIVSFLRIKRVMDLLAPERPEGGR